MHQCNFPPVGTLKCISCSDHLEPPSVFRREFFPCKFEVYVTGIRESRIHVDCNERFYLVDSNGDKISYQPDRIDVDGLFEKGAYLEIKGYMYPEDWKKIQLFREQTGNRLIVVCPDEEYCDINYKNFSTSSS